MNIRLGRCTSGETLLGKFSTTFELICTPLILISIGKCWSSIIQFINSSIFPWNIIFMLILTMRRVSWIFLDFFIFYFLCAFTFFSESGKLMRSTLARFFFVWQNSVLVQKDILISILFNLWFIATNRSPWFFIHVE